ncbi:M15 family metallopeptidase [Campylobacter majalis]|uniref:M15 family metallopeptidase n=1 Tax=Campylobacter majalis TaxID=2790656 RepID=UPI003D68FAD2
MSLGKEQEAFMRDVAKLLNYLHQNGYEVRGGELERTQAQQEIYIKTGKSKTMNSNHLRRCAIDLFIFKNDKWLTQKQELQKIGDFWESLNEKNRWGGNFKNFLDVPHFERR